MPLGPKRITLQDVLDLPIKWDRGISEFVWTKNQSRHVQKGKVAGGKCTKSGYKKLKYHGRSYYVHRIAYVWHTGTTLSHCIDHINGDRGDNRKENLRQVTTKVNSKNKRTYSNNTTGVVGVIVLASGRFNASIGRNYTRLHIGCYGTLEEAARARRGAEVDLGYHANHGNVLVAT